MSYGFSIITSIMDNIPIIYHGNISLNSTMKSIPGSQSCCFLRFAHLRCQHPSLQVICRSWLRHPVGNPDRRDNLCSCEGWIPKMTRHQRLSLPWKFILRPCKKAVKCLAFFKLIGSMFFVLILYLFVVKQKSTWELPEARWYGYGLIRLSDLLRLYRI